MRISIFKMADEDDKQCQTRDLPFEEINFISISSQTNVYGLTKFYEKKSGHNMLLLASLKGQIHSIGSHSSRPGPSSLSSSIVLFKNMQGNVDIVSIDAFNYSSGLTIGMTYVKNSHTTNQKQYLNIYHGYKSELEDIQLASIAESCQSIELDFVPFHLYHTKLLNIKVKDKGVFLLSGNDEKIHIFGKDDKNQEFTEFNLENYFPEFLGLPSSVMWLDVHRDQVNKRRISALACQNGYLKVVVVNEGNENEILNEWTAMHDGPISSVRIFTLKTKELEISEELDEIIPSTKEINENSANIANQLFHVLVTGVIEPSVIYQDIFEYGLSKLAILPESDKYDCVVCSHITDVDWDKNNEILLGTYGQELLVYKLTMEYKETSDARLQSKLYWQKSFSQPLFAIDYVDVTHDGVRELIVTSLKGLHVLQHRFSEIAKRFQDEFAGDEVAAEENSAEN